MITWYELLILLILLACSISSFWNDIKKILPKKKLKKKPHIHDWKLMYMTGDVWEGKSRVLKCDCGQWAVYHFGAKDVTLLTPIIDNN
jgi:hypothetical protein